MIYDEMDELVRDELQAGAEQLERMTVEEFESTFDLVPDAYNYPSDILDIRLCFEKGVGVYRAFAIHLRAVSSEGEPVSRSSDEEFEIVELETYEDVFYELKDELRETFDPPLSFVHPPDVEPTQERLMQGIYEAIIHLMTISDPSMYSMHPMGKINLYTVDGQDIDVTKRHGEPWTYPNGSGTDE